jgi:hypothetical protein
MCSPRNQNCNSAARLSQALPIIHGLPTTAASAFKTHTTTAIYEFTLVQVSLTSMFNVGRPSGDIYSAFTMTLPPTDQIRHQAEYAALRATIRDRGTTRLALLPLIMLGWAAVVVATAAIITVALSTLVPLMVLVGGFEAIFALHVNVERVGRYLQVFHERAGDGWEHIAMSLGRQFPGSGPDPLFTRPFILATSVNFFPAALGGEAWEVIVIGACHLGFVYRIRKAQKFAATQRAEDLRRFEALRDSSTPLSSTVEHSPSGARLTE